MPTLELTLAGHVSPDDKARNDYLYVPFELPAAARLLRVRYRYSDRIRADQHSGGNVIDLGLFDPRGMDFPGGAGFRGWSGSARDELRIAAHDATPGYLPGPLPAGQYHVILGLYRIQPAGARYEIDVYAELADDQATADVGHPVAAGHPTPQAAAAGSFWLRGDLQSHTFHSDAKGSLAQLIDKARVLGLDFLAVTDHNTVSHHHELHAMSDEQLLLIPGQESTTYYGHMNIWGTSRWCDFRCRTHDEMAQVIALAHAHGGVCSINHPKVGGPAWEYGDDLAVDTLEVWQGPWPYRNTESLARWDRLLASGRRLPGVGGSDYHCPADADTGFLRLGQPTTSVWVAERSAEAILAALRAGRASISYAPDGPRLNLRARAGTNTAAMGEVLATDGTSINVEVECEHGAGWRLCLIADGAVVWEGTVEQPTETIRATVTAQIYIRAELVGDAASQIIPAVAPADLDLRDWRWALSNPIYIDSRAAV